MATCRLDRLVASCRLLIPMATCRLWQVVALRSELFPSPIEALTAATSVSFWVTERQINFYFPKDLLSHKIHQNSRKKYIKQDWAHRNGGLRLRGIEEVNRREEGLNK